MISLSFPVKSESAVTARMERIDGTGEVEVTWDAQRAEKIQPRRWRALNSRDERMQWLAWSAVWDGVHLLGGTLCHDDVDGIVATFLATPCTEEAFA
jgi:hypothetical protein